MDNNYQLETGNKLLLLQAINSIEHGLQCLEWLSNIPNENFADAHKILKNRFEYFKYCAFEDAGYDYLIIDKVKKDIKNTQGIEFETKKNINSQLDDLRVKIIDRINLKN